MKINCLFNVDINSIFIRANTIYTKSALYIILQRFMIKNYNLTILFTDALNN
jgi:hypothetical protein